MGHRPMSEFSNVPRVTISPNGISVPETEKILDGVLRDYNTAFGGKLNVSSVSTPQYVLSAETAQAIALANADLAFTLSQFDPATAIGRFQDALARIWFLTRNPGTATIVTATCIGQAGYSIPAGSKARDVYGNIYSSLETATFNELGVASVEFANEKTGAIPCSANSLIYIEEAVFGWDSITNESPGVTGTDVESRAAFEARRYASAAQNGKSTTQAIYGLLNSLEGVIAARVEENDTSDPKTIGVTGYSLKPHSIYVAVVGGQEDDIARAIWTKKPGGVGTNGDVSVIVPDTSYTGAQPEYEIRFVRPTPVPVKFLVTISQDSALGSDLSDQIKAAIVRQYAADNGNGRDIIGATVYASRYVGAVTAISESVNVISLKIGTTTADSDVVQTGIDQMPVVSAENIILSIQ